MRKYRVTSLPLLMHGLLCGLASTIFTCGYLLLNVGKPDFSYGWWFRSGETYFFVGYLILGFSVTAAQSASLIMYNSSDKHLLHPFKLVCLLSWMLALSLSVYITITTIYTGLDIQLERAKGKSIVYQGLVSKREGAINNVDKLMDMMKAYADKGFFAKGEQLYGEKLKEATKRLDKIDDEIGSFDSKKAIASGAGAYDKMAKDLSVLLAVHVNQNRLAVFLKITLLLLISVVLDLTGSVAISRSIEIGEVKSVRAKRLSSPTDELVLDDKKVDPELIRAHLPFRPDIVTGLPDSIEKRYYIWGASRGGKTETIIKWLDRHLEKLIKTNTELIVIDPKRYKPDKWPKLAKVYGTGHNYDEIREKLQWVKSVCEYRDGLMPEQMKKQRPILLIIDELTQLTDDFKAQFNEEFSRLWLYVINYAATNKIYFIGIGHSDTAEALGIKGRYSLLDSMTAIIQVHHDEMVKPSLRYILVKRKGKKTLLFRQPDFVNGKGNIAKAAISATKILFASAQNALAKRKEIEYNQNIEYEQPPAKQREEQHKEVDVNEARQVQEQQEDSNTIDFGNFKYFKTEKDAKRLIKSYYALNGNKNITAAIKKMEGEGSYVNGPKRSEAKQIINNFEGNNNGN